MGLFLLLVAAYLAWSALWLHRGRGRGRGRGSNPNPDPDPNPNPNPNPNPITFTLTRSLGYLPALGPVGLVEMLLPGSHMVSVDYR